MNKTLRLLVMAGLIIAGCTKHCDEFNSEVLSWIPYKVNDTISLKSNSAVSKFIVSGTMIEHTTKIKKNSKCECSDYFGFDARGDSSSIYLSAGDDQDLTSMSTLYIEYHGNGGPANDLFPNKTFLTSLTVGNEIFQDVIVFESDPNTCIKIWKVALAKNKGIVALYYKDSVMVIEKNLDKTTSTTDYHYEESSCD